MSDTLEDAGVSVNLCIIFYQDIFSATPDPGFPECRPRKGASTPKAATFHKNCISK